MPPSTTEQTISRIFGNSGNINELNIEMLQQYIDAGGDVNGKWRGKTMLMWAAEIETANSQEDRDLLQVVKQLIAAGADPTVTRYGESADAILIAINAFNYEITEVMLGVPNININKQFEKGITYLHAAVANGDIDTVNILLEKGANINIQDSEGNTPLIISQKVYIASHINRKDVTIALLDHGADKNISNKLGKFAQDYAETQFLGQEVYDSLAPSINRPAMAPTTTPVNNYQRNFRSGLMYRDNYRNYTNIENNNNNSNNNSNNHNNHIQNTSVKNIVNTQNTQLPEVTQFQVQEPLTVFDPVEVEEMRLSIQDTEEDSDNIYFKVGESYFRLSRDYLRESINKYENIVYECNKPLQGAPRKNNIYKDTPYFLLRSSAIYTVKLDELKAALDYLVWSYELTPSQTIKPTASFASVMSDASERNTSNGWNYPLNYAGRRVNIVSADHCQDGTERQVYSIKPIELKPLTSGGSGSSRKKRQSRRGRLFTRRGRRRGRRTTHNNSKRNKTKTHKSKRR